jgi:hypothetical protein
LPLKTSFWLALPQYLLARIILSLRVVVVAAQMAVVVARVVIEQQLHKHC